VGLEEFQVLLAEAGLALDAPHDVCSEEL